jgi:hypothetical protein
MAEGRTIMTLHSVFIFLQSGETLVSHTSPVVKLDQTLLTGLLTAIREFGHEAIAEEVRTIGAGEYRFHYDVLAPLITVGLADGNADELEVQAVLHSLNVLFFNQYENLLKKWRGDIKPFQTFSRIIIEALKAHNERSQVARKRISQTEYILDTFHDALDVLLINILIGNAIVLTGVDNKIFEQLSEAIDQVLPFTVPNMPGISDLETAQGILESRENQPHKLPTLLGVTKEVFQSLTTPENLEQYLFINLTKSPPIYFAPLHQPSMDLARQALTLSDNSRLEAKILELELETLRAQLNSFIDFRRIAPDFTMDQLRSLLHFDSERFRLLAFLSQESVLSRARESEHSAEQEEAEVAEEKEKERKKS